MAERDVQRDDLESAAYWAAQAIWWARRLQQRGDAIALGRCLECLESRARRLPREYAQRAQQLSDAIERAALLR
jgi:hypothetical protein